MNNGRINILGNTQKAPYMQENNFTVTNDLYCESLRSNIEENCVSKLFFSKLNVDLLQQFIQEEVYKLSNGRYKIGRQSDIELGIIMRSLYLQNGPYSNCDKKEVRKLNKIVIDDAVPKIYSAIKQYIMYKKDVSTLPKPMLHPEYTSNSGLKSAEMKPF